MGLLCCYAVTHIRNHAMYLSSTSMLAPMELALRIVIMTRLLKYAAATHHESELTIGFSPGFSVRHKESSF